MHMFRSPASKRLLVNNDVLDESKTIPSKNCYVQKEFDDIYVYVNNQKTSIYERAKRSTSKMKLLNLIVSLFPICHWLPNYSWRTDLVNDIISGLTIAVMHVPQGLAYSSLAGVPPIVGIYMAIFPVLIYVLMGTSRHASIGTFAVVCIMTGKSVMLYSNTDTSVQLNNNNVTRYEIDRIYHYTPIQVATAVCFVVGIWQVLLGTLRLGSLSVLLSDHLMSGFITGASIVVINSQLKHLFGLRLPRRLGPLNIIYGYVDMFNQRNNINYVTVAITTSITVLLLFYNEVLKARINKKIPIPLPTELLVIAITASISRYMKFEKNYGISVVGSIPIGFPSVSIPPLELGFKLAKDSLIIAIISTSINLSMASIFAKKYNYKVKANQELIAAGCGNIFGSFFSCLPSGASLSRSLIQDMAGGKTQLANVASCIFLSFILLYFGPFFEELPNCVLAGIIFAAMKGMMMKFTDFFASWKQSKIDGVIWLCTFLSVVFLDIDIGLAIGVFLSLLQVTILTQRTKVLILGCIPDTNIYVDSHRYKTAEVVPGLLILHIVGGMSFVNVGNVRKNIFKKLLNKTDISEIILDMTCVTYIDPSSVKCLIGIYNDLQRSDIQLHLAKCSTSIQKVLSRCKFFEMLQDIKLFPTLHDAVIHSYRIEKC